MPLTRRTAALTIPLGLALGAAAEPQRGACPAKTFKLDRSQIKPLASGRGGCIASDRITVDGRPVGFMYRVPTTRPHDSGWCFLAGDESQAYLDDACNAGIYDVNTIANYDPAIVPLLDSPPKTAFAREGDRLKAVPYEEPPP
jgi:hypothetical protein